VQVEFLKAYDNNTWDTEVFEVPDWLPSDCEDTIKAEVLNWAHENLALQAQYRKVVLWAVYYLENEEVPEDE